MRAFCAFGLVSLLLAGHAVAAFDTCASTDVAVLPTPGTACCPAPSKKRAALHRRVLLPRADKYDDGSDPCCTAKDKGPPVVSSDSATRNLQCGQGYDPNSDSQDIPNGVTYSLEPCPADGSYAGQTCFHVKLTAVAGSIISDIHLNIDKDPFPSNVPPALGTWPFNSYCQFGQFAANVGDCWVPESKVLEVLTPTTSLCDQTIYVAAGINIGTATCFNQGTQIGEHPWFMYTVTFNCPDVCTHFCCCPPPPPPPPQFQWCDIGTAIGYSTGAINFNGNPIGPSLGLKTCNRWGWYFAKQGLASPLTGTLLVGGGGNVVAKATEVGTFSATLSGSSLNVVYDLYASDQQGYFDLSDVHVYASCSKPTSCAPGSYTFPGGTALALSGTADTHFETTITISGVSCPTYYLIFHAKVSQRFAASDTCPTAVI